MELYLGLVKRTDLSELESVFEGDFGDQKTRVSVCSLGDLPRCVGKLYLGLIDHSLHGAVTFQLAPLDVKILRLRGLGRNGLKTGDYRAMRELLL